MKVELAKLKDNPFIDPQIDPVDEESAKRLTNSINEHGFWGGAALRQGKNGHLEIACGRTRIYAAIQAGVTHADLHVSRYSDEEMIRVYADENLTQRGDPGLAAAGAVASAVRYLIKGILKGDKHVSQICETSEKGLETVRGNVTSARGLGEECVLRFFKSTPTMHTSLIRHHLANLKAAGVYARIVREVTEEIAQEQSEERAELERREKAAQEAREQAEEAKRLEEKAKAEADAKAIKEAEKARKEAEKKRAEAEAELAEKADVQETRDTAQKAAEAAAKRPITFDLVGVSQYLKTEHQIRVFRKIVERENVRKHIPVAAQKKLAALLVKCANEHNQGELTGSFIKTYLVHLLQQDLRKGRTLDLELTPEALREIERDSAVNRFKDAQHNFCRNWADVNRYARVMTQLKKEYPDVRFPVSNELMKMMKFVVPSINELNSLFNFYRR